jgi:glyoxylase I family protein
MSATTPLAHLPERLHHDAYVVRDQEKNRQFFEDLLGIPLVATWCETVRHPAFGRDVPMCHTFYALADGGAIAFFAFSDADVYPLILPEKPARVPNFDHVAFKVSDAGYDEIIGRVRAAGVAVRETDHGYCRSMYVTSPEGLIVEFTVDLPNAAEIDARRRADAHSELRRWMAGNHRTNNDLRAH